MELRKYRTVAERIRFLSSNKIDSENNCLEHKHTRGDDKLILWLLTPPNVKMEMIMRIQDNILAHFTVQIFKLLLKYQMLLVLEEIYENPILLLKIEKDLNLEFKSKIYMHFFFFAK